MSIRWRAQLHPAQKPTLVSDLFHLDHSGIQSEMHKVLATGKKKKNKSSWEKADPQYLKLQQKVLVSGWDIEKEVHFSLPSPVSMLQ